MSINRVKTYLNYNVSEHFIRCHTFDMGSWLMQLSDSPVFITISLFTTNSSTLNLNTISTFTKQIIFSYYVLNIVASGTFKYET